MEKTIKKRELSYTALFNRIGVGNCLHVPLGMYSKAAQGLITGDLSDEDKLVARRMKAIKYFNDEYEIKEEEVVKLCGKQTVKQIRADEIALLLGIIQSLKDGDTTVDELMKPIRKAEAKSTIAEAAANAAINTEPEKPKK